MPSMDDVYRKFGDAAEAAQLLETELGNLLLEMHVVKSELFPGDRPEDAAAILDRINRCTLGQLLNSVGQKSKDLEDSTELLAQALAERNRLAHSFFRQHNFRRNTDAGRALMLADLESMHATILAAYKAVLTASGIDQDSLHLAALPTCHLKMD